jgi:hypothetical protein
MGPEKIHQELGEIPREEQPSGGDRARAQLANLWGRENGIRRKA